MWQLRFAGTDRKFVLLTQSNLEYKLLRSRAVTAIHAFRRERVVVPPLPVEALTASRALPTEPPDCRGDCRSQPSHEHCSRHSVGVQLLTKRNTNHKSRDPPEEQTPENEISISIFAKLLVPGNHRSRDAFDSHIL